MADSAAFDFACAELESATSLDRLEARGTVRLALKQAGLEARHVTPDQLVVVLARLMPAELESRGVADAAEICRRIAEGLSGIAPETGSDSPDAVFQRLGGGA